MAVWVRSAGIWVVVAALVAACGGGSGGGGGGGGNAVTSGTTFAGSATNRTQWQTALQALAQGASTDPLAFDPQAVAAWNRVLEGAWTKLLPQVAPMVQQEVQTQLAAQNPAAAIQVLAVRNVQLGLQPAPGIQVGPVGAQQSLELHLPRAPSSWSIGLTADVGGTLSFQVLGQPTQLTIASSVDLTVSDIIVRAPVEVDLSQPASIQVVQAHAPTIAFRIAVQSADPLIQSVAGPLTQALDPVVRVALAAVSQNLRSDFQRQLQQLGQAPVWGRGGPPVRQLANPPALEPIADAISDEIQADHMPHDHVWPAHFDQSPGGNVTGYRDHGDAAFWTGHYLAGEAYRWDLTGDPRAIAGATRVLRGIDDLLNVWSPGDALLSRSAMPEASPWFKDIRNNGRVFYRQYRGQRWAALGGVSRDQYIGVMLGLSQAYHRIPSLRADAQRLTGLVLDYMTRNRWVVYMPDGRSISTTFATTPSAVLTFSLVGAVVDPARWAALHQQVAALGELTWFPAWVSATDGVHGGYYKFNLTHAQLTMLNELETDPARYRGHLKLLRVEREHLGHHQNAWFDTVYAFSEPSQGPAWGPEIRAMLGLWTLRPRRGFAVRNSQDPSIPKTTITYTRQDFDQATQQVVTRVYTEEVALHPVPIDKRGPTDYVWQRSPFQLDGATHPHAQEPGIDLLLPYWCARSHGLLR
jgi:hypothetical protein